MTFRTVIATAVFLIASLGIVSTARAVSLEQAQKALALNQFTKARNIAEDLEPQHPVTAPLIYARASLELGQFDLAMASARIARDRNPALAETRVLIAAIYLRQNQPRRAMLALRRALDLSQSDQERRGIRQLLRQIQSNLRLTFQGGLGLAPSTNILKNTAETSVLVPGVSSTPITFDGGPVESGVGLKTWLGLTYVIPQSKGSKFQFSGLLTHDFYSDSAFDKNAQRLQVDWTAAQMQAGHQVFVSLSHNRLHQKSGTDYRSNAAHFRVRQVLKGQPNRALNWALSHTTTRLDDGRSFEDTSGSLDHVWPLGMNSAMRAGVVIGRRKGSQATLFHRSLEFRLGLTAPIAKTGVVADVGLSFKGTRSDTTHPTTLIRPFDKDVKITLGFQNPDVTVFGFTPVAQVTHLKRTSNDATREIESTDVFLGFKNAF